MGEKSGVAFDQADCAHHDEREISFPVEAEIGHVGFDRLDRETVGAGFFPEIFQHRRASVEPDRLVPAMSKLPQLKARSAGDIEATRDRDAGIFADEFLEKVNLLFHIEKAECNFIIKRLIIGIHIVIDCQGLGLPISDRNSFRVAADE